MHFKTATTTFFFSKFFGYSFSSYIYIIFQRKKSHKEVTKQQELMDPDLDPGGPKTYGFYGSGSGSATLLKTNDVMFKL